ncbi:MAG TPA: hypothetical protein VEU07_14115 [Candidatus Acidoferrum sp.]|nr:hypothetical protein [Candidatus Acidoferrum sp.]
MAVICPTCARELPLADINIQADTALCRICGNLFAPSALTRGESIAKADLRQPPPGVSVERVGGETVISASTRSPLAFFFVPFMLVWSGGSLGGIYGSQIYRGVFDPVLSLFGIPFLLGSVFLGSYALMTLLGRVVVRISGGEGAIFTGIGPLGFQKRFRLADIARVEERFSRFRSGNQNLHAIALEGKQRMVFGSLLNDERRYFVLSALRQTLLHS